MASQEQVFSDDLLLELSQEVGETPFHVYSEAGMRESARRLNAAFDWVDPVDGQGYINYFASKALPNPYVHEVLRDEGMGIDASSGPEIQMAKAIGLTAPFIMFTSNNTALGEYAEAYEAGAIVNLDDMTALSTLYDTRWGDDPDILSFRYTPGSKKSDGVNDIIGRPEDAKFGVPDSQIEEAYGRALELGVGRFGLHTMVASNELDATKHVATAEIVLAKAAELSLKLGIKFEFVNLGGGLGIPYEPKDKPLDLEVLRRGVRRSYRDHILGNGLPPLRVVTENGRYVTGPNGVTIFRARSIKDTYHRIVGLDGSTNADGPRPQAYDAYHKITVPGKEMDPRVVQRVVGSLCEDNDYFTGSKTKDRDLPVIEPHDVVAIHDTGAHWHAMTNNYNGKLRNAEFLLREDGSLQRIRRPETRADLFATVDYPGLEA